MSATPRYTRLQLERYLLGELPQDQLAQMRAAEAQNAELKTELDALRQNNKEVLEKFPPDWMGRKIALEARRGEGAPAPEWQSPAPSFWKFALPALVALLVVAFLPTSLHFGNEPPKQAAEQPTELAVRSKGLAPVLEVWRKAGDSAERLASGAQAQSGDVLQIRYSVPQELYGVIVSLDGAGTLTVHLSGNAGRAAKLAGGVHTLERSYQLDDAPQFEKFYLVTRPDSFHVADVAKSLLDGKRPLGETVVVELEK
jgi:hypothetical protein